MQLHELKLPKKRVSRKRVGRGGKRGTTAGRGTKGQRSRAGHRIRPAVRDLIQRLPKLRGQSNRSRAPQPLILDIEEVARRVRPLPEKGKELVVTVEVLKQVGLLGPREDREVKILGKGDVGGIRMILKGLKTSAGARAAVEKAGGKVES